MSRLPTAVVVLCAWVSFTGTAYTQGVDYARIRSIQKAFASYKPDVIAGVCRFPIDRPYPIPAITNRDEFLARFDEVFDREVIDFIVHSDPQTDWTDMGWRGVMLANGILYLADYKVYAVNYQTAKEEAVLQHLVDEDKSTVPEALRDFDLPVLKWTTRMHVVRVDKKDADYRLALFRVDDTSALPEIVLHGGAWIPDGTLGSHLIRWKHGNNVYEIYVDLGSGKDSYIRTPAGTEYPKQN